MALFLVFGHGSGFTPAGGTTPGVFGNRAVTFFGRDRFPPHVRSEDCPACSDQIVPRRSGDAEDSRDLVGMTTSAEKEPWQKAGARWDAPSVNNVLCRFVDFSEACDAEVIGLNGLLRGVFTPLLELKSGDLHRVNSLSLPLVQKTPVRSIQQRSMVGYD
jgi:hypothetical protein